MANFFYIKDGAASSQYLEEIIEWNLIKKDIFGNELVIKNGNQSRIKFKNLRGSPEL